MMRNARQDTRNPRHATHAARYVYSQVKIARIYYLASGGKKGEEGVEDNRGSRRGFSGFPNSLTACIQAASLIKG